MKFSDCIKRGDSCPVFLYGRQGRCTATTWNFEKYSTEDRRRRVGYFKKPEQVKRTYSREGQIAGSVRPSTPPPGRRVFHKHSQSEVNYNCNFIFKKKYYLIKKRKKKKKEEKGGGKEEREKREERENSSIM